MIALNFSNAGWAWWMLSATILQLDCDFAVRFSVACCWHGDWNRGRWLLLVWPYTGLSPSQMSTTTEAMPTSNNWWLFGANPEHLSTKDPSKRSV
jgi:hypothetical protein